MGSIPVRVTKTKNPDAHASGFFVLNESCGNRKADPGIAGGKSVRGTLFRPWEIPVRVTKKIPNAFAFGIFYPYWVNAGVQQIGI